MSHQHIPEIAETLVSAGAKDFGIHFVPVSAPLSRGIFATSFVRIDAAITREQVAAAYHATFEGEPFVRIPKKRLPEVVAVSGSNFIEVGFELGPVEERRRTIACFSVSDNLIKGGAGQVIRSMNIVLGLPEMRSLEDPGGYP